MLRCPTCDKEYTTEAGLKYHVKNAHPTKSPTPPEQLQEQQEDDGGENPDNQWAPHRKAAVRANKLLTKLCGRESPESKGKESMLITEEVGLEEVKVQPPKIDSAKLRAQLETTGEIHCPEQVSMYCRGCGCS